MPEPDPYSTTSDPAPLFSCHVAGVPFRKPDFRLLARGYVVHLIPEPDNQYDPNAIKVCFQRGTVNGEPNYMHLGYIPKDRTAEAKSITRMRITRLEPTDKWNEITIEEVR